MQDKLIESLVLFYVTAAVVVVCHGPLALLLVDCHVPLIVWSNSAHLFSKKKQKSDLEY